MRANRDEWVKRVDRWRESGLTAEEFANELGCSRRSLVFWKWKLGKGARATRVVSSAKVRRVAMTRLPLVELSPLATPDRFELELVGGRRLTIPSGFEADTLRRLLAVLESRS